MNFRMLLFLSLVGFSSVSFGGGDLPFPFMQGEGSTVRSFYAKEGGFWLEAVQVPKHEQWRLRLRSAGGRVIARHLLESYTLSGHSVQMMVSGQSMEMFFNESESGLKVRAQYLNQDIQFVEIKFP